METSLSGALYQARPVASVLFEVIVAKLVSKLSELPGRGTYCGIVLSDENLKTGSNKD